MRASRKKGSRTSVQKGYTSLLLLVAVQVYIVNYMFFLDIDIKIEGGVTCQDMQAPMYIALNLAVVSSISYFSIRQSILH